MESMRGSDVVVCATSGEASPMLPFSAITLLTSHTCANRDIMQLKLISHQHPFAVGRVVIARV